MQNVIKMLRARDNISQEKLAEKIGISRPALSNIERGKMIPSGKTVIRIANYFNIPAEQIFFEKCVLQVEQYDENKLIHHKLSLTKTTNNKHRGDKENE